ncbi:MAG: 50S ribosomal protein L29 [Sulfurovum sp.]|nr:MAG: 50S ribosomal protein L29 [Sulfurovum sp.]
MKASELRNKSADELSKELLESLKEQFILRMQRSTGQLNRHSEMRNVRRKIARIKTIMNETQTAGAGE